MPNQTAETKTRKKVLVVDDEQDFLSIMNFFLTTEGFDVETVCDGAEAMQSIDRKRPDLILLDIVMPVMDGYSTLRALRERTDTRDIPVIMLSIMEKSAREIEAFHLTDYLVKPFSADMLIRKVHETLAA